MDAAKRDLMRMLSMRPASSARLLQKLADKGHSTEVAAAALARMQELGLQDDEEYAEIYTRSKWRQSKWGPARIKMELKAQGLPRGAISKGLKSVFDSEDPSDSGINGDFLALLLQESEKQVKLTVSMPKETRRRRIIGWLQRRGHGWDTIRWVVDALEL